MKRKLRYKIVSFVLIGTFVLSCKLENDQSELSKNVTIETKETEVRADEVKIKKIINEVLFHAGNHNVVALEAMVSDKAMLGMSKLRDGTWSNSEIAIHDFFESVRNGDPSPYYEFPNKYDIFITEGQVAIARAECTGSTWGIPKTREVNHFTFIKADGKWKILNITWTNLQLPENQQKYDVEIFARGYAQAWCSQRPNFVSSFYAEDGELIINKGNPAKGTEALNSVAKEFMNTFPDMIVAMDSLETKSGKTRIHWTLTGTNKGGTGNKVKISGFEEWTLNDKGLIQKSIGSFDESEYKRQLELGTK